MNQKAKSAGHCSADGRIVQPPFAQFFYRKVHCSLPAVGDGAAGAGWHLFDHLQLRTSSLTALLERG